MHTGSGTRFLSEFLGQKLYMLFDVLLRPPRLNRVYSGMV